MKKLYILFIATILISATLSSCKLEDGVDPNAPASPASLTGTSMALTASNTDITFSTCFTGSAEINSVPELLINGADFVNGTAGAASFELEIIKDPKTVQTGDTFTVSTSLGAVNSAVLYYSPDANNNFATQPKKPEGTVTLTEVTATTIKGTFSGVLYKADDLDGTTVAYTVTNGSFTAARLD